MVVTRVRVGKPARRREDLCVCEAVIFRGPEEER
jgi:hypothetical protein